MRRALDVNWLWGMGIGDLVRVVVATLPNQSVIYQIVNKVVREVGGCEQDI